MDSTRNTTTVASGASGPQTQNDSTEQLLDVFKAAALSVTKLYKTSAVLEARARAEGYQECLDDILAFLDKESMGLGDGEGWRVRRWATERLDGRDPVSQQGDSDEETEKAERATSPENVRTSGEPQPAAESRTESAPPTVETIQTEPVQELQTFVVPTSDTFTFQSSHPYPNIATLDLSDSRAHEGPSRPRTTKGRNSTRSGPRSSAHLGRGAGAKRKMDFDDFFGGCLGGKDVFGGGSKRSRHD